MHIVEKLHQWYFRLPDLHRVGFLGKVVDKLEAKALKPLMDKYLPKFFLATQDQYPGLNQNKRDTEIICSLTTFPARIDQVWVAIECLFRQSVLPDRIILWLSKEQFPDLKLPESLMSQQKRGLEIKLVEDDIKAHKKYHYALKRFPNAIICTFDDDLYYDKDIVKNLLTMHKSFPDKVITNRAHKITFDENGKILPYKMWKHNVVDSEPSMNLFVTGGYGTIYRTHLFADELFEVETLKRLSFLADDVWLKGMSALKGVEVVTNKTYGKDPIPILSSQHEKLVTSNVLSGGNDEQFNSVIKHFNLTFSR